MAAPDFSRQDIVLFSTAAGIAGLIVGAASGYILIGSHIGDAAWAGVGGALVGGFIGVGGTALTTARQELGRRNRELAELKASIYAEIADRAARCVNDYIKPWRDWNSTSTLSVERVGKFRPMEPVVLTGIAGKLGLFEPKALLAVTQFYFRLGAVSQAIDSLVAVCEKRGDETGMLLNGDPARARLIAERLRSCFEPALRALEGLDVPEAAAFDEEVSRVYPWLAQSGDSLREALKKHKGA
jgi:hypothetical protein